MLDDEFDISKLKFQDCFDELSDALDNGNASRQLELLQKK